MIDQRQELILESRLESLHEIEHFVEEIGDYYNINNTYFGNILVALTEAFKNAAIHGNKLDPDKKVTIVFQQVANGLAFSVQDEGTGFDPSTIPDPTDLEESEATQKGLYLIRKLSDNVVFKEGGAKLDISFRISGINYELGVQRANMLHQYFNVTEKKNQHSEH
jgi:serine/threonine-protein kinase RsbW